VPDMAIFDVVVKEIANFVSECVVSDCYRLFLCNDQPTHTIAYPVIFKRKKNEA